MGAQTGRFLPVGRTRGVGPPTRPRASKRGVVATSPARELRETAGDVRGWVDASVPADADLVVLIGAGDTVALAMLRERPAPPRVLLLEPDAVAATRIHAGWSDWIAAGRLVMLVGPLYGRAAEIARTFRRLSAAPVLVDTGLASTRPEEVAAARRVLEQMRFEA